MELWKTIDWNALIKVSDISHIYGIHENCDITEEFGYLGKSKLGCKQIDKEQEVKRQTKNDREQEVKRKGNVLHGIMQNLFESQTYIYHAVS